MNYLKKSLKDYSLIELRKLYDIIEQFYYLPEEIKVNLLINVDGIEYSSFEMYISERERQFFNTCREDYKKLEGKAFINENETEIVIITKFNEFLGKEVNFLYESYIKYFGQWMRYEPGKYMYLHYQMNNNTDSSEFYKEHYKDLSEHTLINMNAEGMYQLGIDGCLYSDPDGDGYYIKYTEMTHDAKVSIIKELSELI